MPRPPTKQDPIPVETVRDLLGLCRLLWRHAAKAADWSLADGLMLAGKDLRRAIDRAEKARKGSGAHQQAAWVLAERGTNRLFCLMTDPLLRQITLDLKGQLGFERVKVEEREMKRVNRR